MEDGNFSPENKNILIVGAGIAGPTLAYWLNRYGFSVTVIEKAPGIRKAGYRVNIRGAAVGVAECMGIMNGIRAHHPGIWNTIRIDSRGRHLNSVGGEALNGLLTEGDAEISRGDLAGLLYEATRNDVEYIFGDSISAMVDSKQSVQVRLASGEHRSFDLVIGADGLQSAVRKLVFAADDQQVCDSGYHFALFNFPNSMALDHQEWSGRASGVAFQVFSAANSGQATAMLTFDAGEKTFEGSSIRDQKRMLLDHFSGARGVLKEILQHLPGSSNFYLDKVAQVKMNRIWHGRVALLGDAGYSTSMASGQDTSVAMIGAYVLAGELAAAGGDHRAGFRNYASRMQAFVLENQRLGAESWKALVPRSALRAQLSNWLCSFMEILPIGKKMNWKKRVRQQENMRVAANSIELKDYTPEEDWAEWLQVFRELIVDRV